MKAAALTVAGVFAGLHLRQACADPLWHVLAWQDAKKSPSPRAWLLLALAGIELPETKKD